MKNMLKIASLLLFTLTVNCQTLPLNTTNAPEGSYLKDLNNELPFWTGTWEGIANGKKYTFQFTLFPHHLNTFSGVYEDNIKGKFKVVDIQTNQTLYNNLSVTNYEDYNILGIVIREGCEFDFTFFDNEYNCYNKANFILVKNYNSNTIEYKELHLSEYNNSCTYYQNQTDIPMFLPTTNLTLTRQ
jgi:hypothetical protein